MEDRSRLIRHATGRGVVLEQRRPGDEAGGVSAPSCRRCSCLRLARSMPARFMSVVFLLALFPLHETIEPFEYLPPHVPHVSWRLDDVPISPVAQEFCRFPLPVKRGEELLALGDRDVVLVGADDE